MSNYCSECGSKLVVDRPPFEDMTDEDKISWKESGGKMVVYCTNGCIEKELL
ncbi:MAG: hypothetical protein AABY22_21045 [Nanoarchaeota archaeon]